MGVTVTIFVPCVVSWSQSLCCMWCCGCCCHLCAACGFMVPVIVLHGFHGCGCCAMWVLLLPSLHCVWCRSCHCCAACGFMVTVVVLHRCHGHGHHAVCGVAGAIIVPRVVLQLWWLALEGEDGHMSVGKGGGESMVTGPQKRKLVEKRKKKPYKQGVSQCKKHSNVVGACGCRDTVRWGHEHCCGW